MSALQAESQAHDPRAQVALLLGRDRWSRPQLLELQRRALRALLDDACRLSPYYREALGPNAADLPLDRLPTLPKPTLMEEFDRIVTDPRVRLAEIEAHLAGPAATEPFLGEYRVFSTAGTTGVRGVFLYSEDEFATWVSICLRGMARIGVTPATRLVGIGAPSHLHMSKQLIAAFAAGRQPGPQLSVVTPLPELVEALNAFRPEALITYPTVAAFLAEEQLECRLRIDPRIVMVVSEVVTDEARGLIHDAWGTHPFEVYASTEVPLISSSSPEHVGMHVTDDFAIVEVVDEQNRPVTPGEPGAKVLLTNLVNRAQPLIRYELSDSVTAAGVPDPSGRPYGRILRVDGRSDDILKFPGPDGPTVAVNPFRLCAPFAHVPDVRQYQIVEEVGGLRVRVVLRRGAPSDTAERVRAALVAELESAGAVPPAVEVLPVAELEREPGHAAKFKLVKALR
jgi:phenylacetate-CoA ligase